MNEHEFVVEQFRKAFSKWRNEPFVLYGLGKNTQMILENAKGFSFAGLMDAQNTGKTFWGLRVLSEEEALGMGARIVIIARESVVPVIYARIAHLQELGIKIYDFKGELLGQDTRKYNNWKLPYWNVTEDSLRRAIDEHDCISFDIFDTLLMRRTLRPDDVFEIVERCLEKQGYLENHFRERRMFAEKSLNGCPTLDRIYDEMGELYHIPKAILSSWETLELETEGRVLVPRRRMINAFNYALMAGKQVFLISDMYLPRKTLVPILKKYQIDGYSALLVSCDYQVSKEENGKLYDVYLHLAKGERYLHIGDNRQSDGECARNKGIDTFQVYSAYEMWMASSMQCSLAHLKSLEQRCIIANLVWRCCEDPFALQTGRGMLMVDTPWQLGYIFLGALYDEFLTWLIRTVTAADIEQLLLPARDGFLIAHMLAQVEQVPFEAVYFKASRRAVSTAALRTEKDIVFLAERGFQGTFGELLRKRFGVEPRADDVLQDQMVQETGNKAGEYALSYREDIFARAEKERNEYLPYLRKKIKNNHSGKRAVFDFVASGTVQFFLQRLLGEEMKGFYFATMNHPNECYHLEESIVSSYGNIRSYGTNNQVAKHYLFLESIMVDGFPTLRCIENGNFVYELGTENASVIASEVQEGILHYQRDMEEMRQLVPNWQDERNFADELFGMLFDGRCQVNQTMKSSFLNDDSFDGVASFRIWKK